MHLCLLVSALGSTKFTCTSFSGLQFIRAEGFVFSHVADEGIIDSCAGQLLRYRRSIGAEDIMVFADIKKKHWLDAVHTLQPLAEHDILIPFSLYVSWFLNSSHAITADMNVTETAKAAEFFQCDGVILTGSATGQPPSSQELKGTNLVQIRKIFM